MTIQYYGRCFTNIAKLAQKGEHQTITQEVPSSILIRVILCFWNFFHSKVSDANMTNSISL